ncbi:hemolysin family protein [Flavobacteriaceae bacterium]|nr:hemolysin family protein [Flavobacteriaceae bacterium]MDA8947711.1 hemolysin family protein [Flavobacteriaceae bacterium]MDC3354013.1 hemolysin family protein [Flavobacteriaceae bacterium]
MNPTDLIIIICLVLSAFFSGMEIAFVSSNRIYLEIEKLQTGLTSRILKKITQYPSRFIASMLLGNNIALVVYGIFMGDRILQLFFSNTLLTGDVSLTIVFYQTLISTGIILLTAEFLPKVFFQLYANNFIKIFALPVAIFYYLFYPISFLIIGLTDLILKRFLNTETDQVQLSFSKIELGNYIEEQLESAQDKENLDSEIQIFQNALDFSEVKTREAMVPRAEVIAVEQSTSLEDITALFISTGLSKIPVYKENIDHILGYVHAFEMMKQPKGIKNILMPVAYVPETMLVNDVLKLLTRQHKSIAVVIDEYGGTSGIVTVEDIVEELFGEIEDEYDTVEHIEEQIEEDVFDFSARLEVDYLNQKYNLSLPESEYYETLGGMIAYTIGEIPEKEEEIQLSEYVIKIKKVSATKIEQIILTKSVNT